MRNKGIVKRERGKRRRKDWEGRTRNFPISKLTDLLVFMTPSQVHQIFTTFKVVPQLNFRLFETKSYNKNLSSKKILTTTTSNPVTHIQRTILARGFLEREKKKVKEREEEREGKIKVT